jgi:hypothetical protein
VRDGEIFIRTTKNGKNVKLPVHADLQAALDVLPLPHAADGPDCPFFFWSGRGDRRTFVRDVTRTMSTVFKALAWRAPARTDSGIRWRLKFWRWAEPSKKRRTS